jgi:threonine synthase
MTVIHCDNCHNGYPQNGVPYNCPTCGGVFGFSEFPTYSPPEANSHQFNPWRFKHLFGLPENAPEITLGEGNTPLVWKDAYNRRIAFKLEYLNPTGSFKDRGTALLISFLLSRGVEKAIEDSSGNAGASFAAYAASVGIDGKVFLPDDASGPKITQIDSHGLEVVRILGPRSNAAEAVRREADQGAIYASHTYLPQGIPGFAVTAYEIVEQIGGAPGCIIAPVGQGSLLLGVGYGFESLRNAGVIDHVPALVGVQALECAPLWAVFVNGPMGLAWVREGKTIAEGVRIRNPLRGDTLLRMVEASQGTFVAVQEEAIMKGRDYLAQLGFYVEPTSAIVWDALGQVIDHVREPIIVLLTGSGLKFFE